MADRPRLRLDESTLCLHVETKASPLLGQHAFAFPSTPPCKSSSTTPTSVSSLSSSSSGQVCYICQCEASEEPLLRSFCGCKKQVVHPKCLATWLQYSAARRDDPENPQCEVCLEEYKLPASVKSQAFVHMPRTPRATRARQPVSPAVKSYSIPAIMAFVYGFSFASVGKDMESLLCVCMVGNVVVLMAWLLFVVGRRRLPEIAPETRAVEDSIVLLCVYIAFLCGWVLQEWSMPQYNKTTTFAIPHIVNAGFLVFGSTARLVHLCKLCCFLMCFRPPATITLDLGD